MTLARTLRNPHAEATTGVDLQVPAIMMYLDRHGLALHGTEVVDIGFWEGQASHPNSIRLSPLHIKVVGDPKMTLESFWQSKKCLAVWDNVRRRKNVPRTVGVPRAPRCSSSYNEVIADSSGSLR